MTDKLDDVWATRDFPVLREAVRLIDSGEAQIPETDRLARATGLDEDTVERSLYALQRRGFVRLGAGLGGPPWVEEVSGEAYLVTGLHPGGQDTIAALINALRQAEEATDDPEEKTLLRRAGGAIGSVSQNVMGQVLAAYIRSQTGI